MPGYIETEDDPMQREVQAEEQKQKVRKLNTWMDKAMQMTLWCPSPNGTETILYGWWQKSNGQVNYSDKAEHRCDVCGANATEALYKFRCYRREDARARLARGGRPRKFMPSYRTSAKNAAKGFSVTSARKPSSG